MIYGLLLLAGILAGAASGLFGIGGGVILVPFMVFMLGFTQITASGTSLAALVIPVGAAIGVWQYFAAGKIGQTEMIYGAILALGMAVGAYYGARLAVGLDETTLKRGFAVLLIFVSMRLWITA